MRHKKLLLLAVLFFVLTFQSVNAQEITPSATPTPVQYTLPYPGLLPGNPLYFLKEARDAVVGFLVSNPVKKAEFDLLQADKNMQATIFLVEQKKENTLVFATLGKAEDNFAKAITSAEDAKKQGINVKDLATKLALANLKYQEVVTELSKSAKGNDKEKFMRELETIKQLGQKVKALQR